MYSKSKISLGPAQERRVNASILGLMNDVMAAGGLLRLRVTGNSMGPFIKSDDIVVISPADASSIGMGDVLLFVTHAGYPMLHRVVGKKRADDGSLAYLTKGDASQLADGTVGQDDIIGRVTRIERGAIERDIYMPLWRAVNYLAALLSIIRSFRVRKRISK